MRRIVDYSILPEHMQDGAKLYVERGIEPGGFMYAILCNDFVSAAGQADRTNQQYLFEWASWLSNELPQSAWGSVERVDAWIEKGGYGVKD